MYPFYLIYGDKDLSVFNSREDQAMPVYNVQVIVQYHDQVGWHTQSGYDFYIRRKSRWVGVDRAGLFDDMLSAGVARFNLGMHHLVLVDDNWVEVDEFGIYRWLQVYQYALFGRTLTTRDFHAAMSKAMCILSKEKRPKTGLLPDERKPDYQIA